MDNQLLLGLLFVTLSWGFMGTHAQTSNMTTPGMVNGSTTTTALPNSATMMALVNATAPSPSMNPVSASSNMANNATTMPGTAVTSSTNMTNTISTMTGSMVTSSTNMTNNALTTKGTMVTSSTNTTNNTSTMTGSMVTSSTNMTNNTSTAKGTMVTSSTNMTNNTSTMTGSMVTSSTNMTNNTSTTKGTMVTSSTNTTNNTSTMTGSMVTSSTNMTNNTSTTTTGTMVTSSTNMTNNTSTVTAVLVSNTTVETLQTNISRAGCGTTFLCAAQPSMCDPSSGGSCFFLGAKPNGANFDFELSGLSDGYIAATVSTGTTLGNNDTTYVCARRGQGVQFFGARLIGNRLTKFPVIANSVRGRAIGNLIQCAFLATVPTAQTRAIVYSASVSTGPYNETSGELGNTTDVIRFSGVNLADSNATITNEITANTNTAPTVTGNNTGSNAITAAPTVTGNNTGSNATTAASNSTTVTTTTTSAATTMIPVAALQTPISRTNCGSTKLCAAQPSACNPATGVGCFFISAQQQSGQLYNFELSGESSGYVAAGVSTSSNANGTNQVYVCANNNGAVRFFTGTITNLALNLTQLNVSNVKGAINSRKIQCTFAATLPDTATRAAAYSLSVSNGTYNPDTATFGTPRFLLFTNLVNLSDPTSNATNQISNGAYPATYQQPLIPALLVTVVMLTFSMM